MSDDMEIKGPNWTLPKHFGESDAEFDGEDFSALLILVLRQLHDAFPDSVDLNNHNQIVEDHREMGQLWSWLKAQGVANGGLANCSLTLSGKQSYDAALHELPTLAALLAQPHGKLEGADAGRLLIAVLRHQFLKFGQKTKNLDCT
ncbi:MAG: hypothetical protein GY948_07775 [Alphaproteobacteria bacterium]|nr:hypothetical protein [Alphaproteobacteria bacterium]